MNVQYVIIICHSYVYTKKTHTHILTNFFLTIKSKQSYKLFYLSLVSVNIAFNCSITFPGSFGQFLQSLDLINFDIMPSLGLQCSWERYNIYLEKEIFFFLKDILKLYKNSNIIYMHHVFYICTSYIHYI